jgi:ABC-type uncharacterized transport system ATPase subunit
MINMATKPNIAANDVQFKDARDLVRRLVSKEIIFGVVGPVGSGTSEVADALYDFLAKEKYNPIVLKARDVIAEIARKLA